jgi:hypothetical protein
MARSRMAERLTAVVVSGELVVLAPAIDEPLPG